MMTLLQQVIRKCTAQQYTITQLEAEVSTSYWRCNHLREAFDAFVQHGSNGSEERDDNNSYWQTLLVKIRTFGTSKPKNNNNNKYGV